MNSFIWVGNQKLQEPVGCVSAPAGASSLSSNFCTRIHYRNLAIQSFLDVGKILRNLLSDVFDDFLYHNSLQQCLLNSISRIMQLQMNQHKTSASDKYVLIWVISPVISSIAVSNTSSFFIFFSPSSMLP